MSRAYILIVEDEVLVRMLLADHLREEGYRVAEASHADEALELLENEAGVTAVITDVRMPGTMDGLALSRVVASRWSHVKVILTSGYLGSESIQLPSAASFVPKPYQPDAIAALLQAELG